MSTTVRRITSEARLRGELLSACDQGLLAPQRPHAQLGFVDLIIRIVRRGDREALRELHDHRTPLLHGRDGRQLRISEYLDLLKNGGLTGPWCEEDASILERAYDLTIDKLSHLPNRTRCKSRGPDCRFYFRAFLKHLRRRRRASKTIGALEMELLAASVLRGLITRHFYFSCLEARRRGDRSARRFFWSVQGRTICLKFPPGMTARQCRDWLESNVTTVRPIVQSTVMSVQAVIDERLFFPQSLARRIARPITSSVAAKTPSHFAANGGDADRSLAHFIAHEKAEMIDHQRPAIQALGKSALIALVQRVFEDVASGQYRPSVVARTFGLSKAAMSRFAGSRWSTRAHAEPANIPDLWRNMAQILAGDEGFIEAAKKAGVWDRVVSIARPSTDGSRP